MLTPEEVQERQERKQKIADLASRLLIAAYGGMLSRPSYDFRYSEQADHAVNLAKALYARLDKETL